MRPAASEHATCNLQAHGLVQLASSDQILQAFYVDDSYKLLSGAHAHSTRRALRASISLVC